MSNVVAVIRILPESDTYDLQKLREDLRSALPADGKVRINKFEEEPLAFGLKALKVYVIIPGDYAGGTQSIEDAFAKVPGASQVDVEIVQTLF